MKLLLRQDSILLLGLGVFIFLVWNYIFDLPLDSLYGANDLFGHLSFAAEVTQKGTLSSDLIYSSFKLGGSAIGPLDTPFMLIVANLFSSSPVVMTNLSILFTQSILAFCVLKIIQLSNDSEDIAFAFLWAVVAAFSPAIGWRIFYGHLNLIWGCILALGIVYSLMSLRLKQVSATGICVTSLIIITAVHTISTAQTFLYSLIICLIYMLINLRNIMRFVSLRSVAGTVFIGLVSLLFSLNHLANVRLFLQGLSRNINSDMIYSYTIQTTEDFVSSIFLFQDTYPSNRMPFLLHETNLALGVLPFIVVGLLGIHRNYRLLLAYLLIICFGVILSANVQPLSEWITSAFPPLRGFRVPSRFFIPFNLLTILIVANALGRNKPQSLSTRDLVIYGLGGVTLGMLTLPISEYVTQALFICLIIGSAVILGHRRIFLPMALGSLLALHFGGFIDKRIKGHLTADQLSSLSRKIKIVKPSENLFLEHTSSLVHTQLNLHQASILGYHSVDANIPASARFLSLFLLLNPEAPHFTTEFLINSKSASFPIFAELLNVTGELTLTPAQTLGYEKLRESQPFFTPKNVRDVNSAQDFLENLSPAKSLSELSFIEPAYLSETRAKPCDDLQLLARDAKSASIHVKSEEDCLIILTTNYSPFLQASKARAKEISFKPLPVNWIQTGFYLPKGDYELTVDARSILPYEGPFKVFSFLLLITFIIFLKRLRSQ